jgi:hypothetical protein
MGVIEILPASRQGTTMEKGEKRCFWSDVHVVCLKGQHIEMLMCITDGCVGQELVTLSELLHSLPVCSEVRVTRALVLYVCFVDRCLSFCSFVSFDHCVVCSSIYGIWLPFWYLQALLTNHYYIVYNSIC